MKIVIDLNRIIAALVKNSTTREIIIKNEFNFITPDYTISELQEHKVELIKKTKLSNEEFELLISLIFEHIIVIPELNIKNSLRFAKKT